MISKKSFTLIELIMVMVIIGIIAGIAVPIMLTTADAWSLASRFQDNAVSTSIIVQNRMAREIRRLLNDASVTTATATQFSFTFIDLNGNLIPVTYNRSGNTLMRYPDALMLFPDGLADNVTALDFTYYDDNNIIIPTPVPAANLKDIRRIQARFSILAGTNTLNFQFAVRPQNLRRLNEKFN